MRLWEAFAASLFGGLIGYGVSGVSWPRPAVWLLGLTGTYVLVLLALFAHRSFWLNAQRERQGIVGQQWSFGLEFLRFYLCLVLSALAHLGALALPLEGAQAARIPLAPRSAICGALALVLRTVPTPISPPSQQ